jgi:hypothetical protein
MKQFKKIIAFMTVVTMLGSTTPVFAASNAVGDLFLDAFYGAALGALAGGAILVFTKKPADNLDFMAMGAAAGVLAGMTYGILKSTNAFVSVENGNLKIAMPTIIPEVYESPVTKQMTVSWRADILRGTFN